MEPDQVHVVTGAVLRGLEQVIHAVKTRLAGQIIRDIRDTHRHDRIHHDLSLVHAVMAARFDMGPRPDANAAPDPPAPDSLANAFGKHHEDSSPDGNSQERRERVTLTEDFDKHHRAEHKGRSSGPPQTSKSDERHSIAAESHESEYAERDVEWMPVPGATADEEVDDDCASAPGLRGAREWTQAAGTTTHIVAMAASMALWAMTSKGRG